MSQNLLRQIGFIILWCVVFGKILFDYELYLIFCFMFPYLKGLFWKGLFWKYLFCSKFCIIYFGKYGYVMYLCVNT